MPIHAEKFKTLLQDANYPETKMQYLYQGFKNGFLIGYTGRRDVKLTSGNLRLRVGNHVILWNKIMKEVRLKHYVGPFETVPFQHYIQSPVGLVDKDHGRDTRLIFHLSFPRKGKLSWNANTPAELCSVKYADFDQAIRLCLANLESENICWLCKSDAKSTFTVIGLNPPVLAMVNIKSGFATRWENLLFHG